MRQRIAIIVLELLLSMVLISSVALAAGGPVASSDAQALGAPPEGPLVMVGQIGGGITAVAVQGNLACVGQGARLVTIDIKNPLQPLFQGQSGFIPTGVAGIAMAGTLAYVAALEGGVYAVDVSNPAQPDIVGHYDTAGTAVTIVVEGSHAYVADGDKGLAVLDISDPVHLTQVGSFPANQSFYEDVVLSASRAYVTDLSGLAILDISDPTQPTELGYHSMVSLGKGTSGVAVAGSYAYVGLQLLLSGNTLNVIDVSNPAQTSEVGSVSLSGSTGRLTMAGNYVYVSIGSGGVQTVDVSVPKTPTSVNVYDTLGSPLVLAVAGGNLHIADECGGYRIASLANPAQPQDQSIYSSVGCVTRVAADGSHAYIDSEIGFSVVDVTDPAQADVVGLLDLSTAGLDVAGNYAYVADGASAGSLHVIDVANPAAPTQVGSLALAGQPSAVAIQGSYAYVTGQNTGLRVVNIATPASPQLAGSRAISGASSGVAVSGNAACLAGGSAGLRVINVSNPASPGAPVVLDTPGTATDVAIAESLAYVADEDGGLRIVDISNTATLTETSFYTSTVQATGLVVVGDYVYLANGYSGISLIDISEPTKPFEFTSAYAIYGNAQDVDLVGDLLYVADGAGGLAIWRVTVPTHTQRALGEAWNLFSFNVEPISVTVALTDVQSILLSVNGEYSSVLGYDQGAKSYYPDLDPEFNDLKALDWQHGYWLKMNQADTLKITGWPVDPTTDLPLDAGWNLVSYLPGDPISVTIALDSIADQYTSVLGFHDGAAVSYYPDLDPSFSDLRCLRPQHGYWIKTTAATTLNYPSTGTCTEAAPSPTAGGVKRTVQRTVLVPSDGAKAEQVAPEERVRPDAQPAPAEQVTPTNRWWDVYSTDTRCAGAPVVEGTIIQAYDPQGVVCGLAVAHAAGAWGVMHVYGDDPATPEDEGADVGDAITFTINGKPAQVGGQAIWQERVRQQVQLASSSCGPYAYLPTIQ